MGAGKELAAAAILLSLVCIGADCAHAQDGARYVRNGVPQPLPAEDLLPAYGDEYGASIRAAIAGDCAALLKDVHTESRNTFSNFYLEAELYDRGLCLPFDPAEAARKWISVDRRFSASNGELILSWKHYYGHGVALDREESRNLFIRQMMDLYLWMDLSGLGRWNAITTETLSEFVLGRLAGRPAPQAFLDGLAWTEKQTSTDDGAIELAKALIWGGSLRYVDGGRLPHLPKSGVSILSNVDSLEARYLSGKAGLDGLSNYGHDSILHALTFAAHCRHAGAAVELANLYHHGNTWLERDLSEAEKWRRLALIFGAKEEEMFRPIFLHRVFGLQGPAKDDLEYVLTGRRCLHN